MPSQNDQYLNLAGLRTAFRVRTGLVEAGSSGDDRLSLVLNLSLRHLWNDLPQVFSRQEVRLQLEAPYESGTLDVCPTDARIFRSSTSGSKWSSLTGYPGTLRGRWIDITDTDGIVRQFRIKTAGVLNTTTDWGSGGSRDVLVLDKPWHNRTDTALVYKIYTLDYPLPADISDITDVIRNPEGNGFERLSAIHPREMDQLRLGSWLSSGVPEHYADGDFFQLRAPHEAPTVVATVTPTNAQKWGYNDSGTETTSYGPAGTFSYCYCLVWGCAQSPSRLLTDDDGATIVRPPFYISAPSPVSSEVATTWGAGRLVVTTANQDWADARKYGLSQTLNNKNGLEKWIFRARHATDSTSGPTVSRVEADEVFRLWRIMDGNDTVTYDKGDSDPVDYSFPLKEFSGHKSIRFDRLPSDSETQVLVRATARPDTLKYDTDIARVPPESLEAIVSLAAMYISERDGEFTRAQYYRNQYENIHLVKLREKHGWTSTRKGGFGDGLSSGSQRSWSALRPISSES